MQKIIERLQRKVSNPDLLSQLNSLTLSELNTLLMATYKNRTGVLTPPQVLDAYANNRFAAPSDIDAIELRETELTWLKLAKSHQFDPLVLSPLAPLGTTSAIAKVDQNNVVSALRGTEVVSDATNVLALQLSSDFKKNLNKNKVKHYAAVHRHTRGQAFDNPKFSAHFSTFCLASGGIDSGNFGFELRELDHHLRLIYEILQQHIGNDMLSLTFYVKKKGEQLLKRIQHQKDAIWSEMRLRIENDMQHTYYQLLQFKVFIHKDGQSYNIADGGFTDWTQKLLSNKKHRCLISGVGLELLHRI